MRVCLALPGVNCQIDEEIFASASATNSINRAIGDLLRGYGRLATDSDRDGRPLHQAKLPEGQRSRPCCDGGDRSRPAVSIRQQESRSSIR